MARTFSHKNNQCFRSTIFQEEPLGLRCLTMLLLATSTDTMSMTYAAAFLGRNCSIPVSVSVSPSDSSRCRARCLLLASHAFPMAVLSTAASVVLFDVQPLVSSPLPCALQLINLIVAAFIPSLLRCLRAQNCAKSCPT